MRNVKITIIILHYGDIKVTQSCVSSLLKHETAKFDILIVNNASEKLTLKTFRNKANISIINNEKNVGFAGGVNIGIRYVLSKKTDHILLLNNDTQIDKPFLKSLTDFFATHKEAGIVGPAIAFHRNGELLYDLGGNLSTIFGRTSHTEVEKIIDANPRKSTYITGACMLVKREVFENVGLFDERFFLYYEDVDFCLRAHRKGFESYVLPSIIIHHALSKSAGGVSPLAVYHQTKSGVLFGKKWCKKTRIFNVLFLTLQSLLFLMKSKKLGVAAFKGMRDGIKKAAV